MTGTFKIYSSVKTKDTYIEVWEHQLSTPI